MKAGHLRVPVNYVAALQCDPTEKKPFFHVLPGSDTLTFGMLGCDLHCAYCQNWLDLASAARRCRRFAPKRGHTRAFGRNGPGLWRINGRVEL